MLKRTVGSNPTLSATKYIYAAVAQLAEASGLGPEGWGFDSLQRHHSADCITVCTALIKRLKGSCSPFKIIEQVVPRKVRPE